MNLAEPGRRVAGEKRGGTIQTSSQRSKQNPPGRAAIDRFRQKTAAPSTSQALESQIDSSKGTSRLGRGLRVGQAGWSWFIIRIATSLPACSKPPAPKCQRADRKSTRLNSSHLGI